MNPHVEFDIAVETAAATRKEDLVTARDKCQRLYDLAATIYNDATVRWREETEQAEEDYEEAITEARLKFRAALTL